MNPSTQGWINKFGSLIKEKEELFANEEDLYTVLRTSGFVYGANVEVLPFLNYHLDYSEDELAKINLITALFFTYTFHHQKTDFNVFINEAVNFYKELEGENFSFIDKLFGGAKTDSKLEKYLHSRVQIDENILTKSFNKIITNSLLYVDVLTFDHYLKTKESPKEYAKKLERIIINLAYHTLLSKEEKTKNDEQLLYLFEASLSYHQNTSVKDFDGTYLSELKSGLNKAEQKYLIDIACMAAWEDKTFEYKESDFIFGIGHDLGLKETAIEESLEHVTVFFNTNKEKISIFKVANPAKQFYDNANQTVKKLITRNSKRLSKELSQSKELLFLLSKSTSQELSDDERKKVREQLLDIFKSIPSLAIFALPGGAILLPLFIKLIPKLLPSAFDDNRVEE
ncbi:LETM1-related biofilm-associated protein [Zhouia spongiae]|uniref:LETM1-related biofilm-associated protein n=1 Tax=Zhouia spongiae TaxID=2202721 RepID=A0ABY3YJ51_9FLAO|nr:LETM1-related biofilm-associated protein [Zhouia spongiae]UNY97618.1 LETM1-related biofilm-associated protein [Zhouia spongiae]